MARESNPSRRTSLTLINRVKDLDDEDGWRQFFGRYRRLVMSIGVQHGLDENEAEDVAQEVFSRVARNIGVFETRGRPGAFRRWLGNLTTWCALTAIRNRGRRVQPLEPTDSSESDSPSEPLAESTGSTPLSEVTDRDFHELLLKRLKQLVSAKDYQIYQWITFEGMTPQQVADRLGLRRGTVDTILSRTRLAARQELERLGERI